MGNDLPKVCHPGIIPALVSELKGDNLEEPPPFFELELIVHGGECIHELLFFF